MAWNLWDKEFIAQSLYMFHPGRLTLQLKDNSTWVWKFNLVTMKRCFPQPKLFDINCHFKSLHWSNPVFCTRVPFLGKTHLPSDYDTYMAGGSCLLHRHNSHLDQATADLQRRRCSGQCRSAQSSHDWRWGVTALHSADHRSHSRTWHQHWRSPRDSDIRYGVSDGIKFIGFATVDKSNYHTHAPCYGCEGVSGLDLSSIREEPVRPEPSDTFYPGQFVFTLKLNERWGSCYTAHDGGFVRTADYNNRLMLSKGITLEVYKSDKGETVGIRYIKVAIIQDEA